MRPSDSFPGNNEDEVNKSTYTIVAEKFTAAKTHAEIDSAVQEHKAELDRLKESDPIGHKWLQNAYKWYRGKVGK